jgi:hypothetical protein
VEGVARPGAFVGRGLAVATEVDGAREASPAEVGRIQVPVRTSVPFPLRIVSESSARPLEGLDLRWTSARDANSPR